MYTFPLFLKFNLYFCEHLTNNGMIHILFAAFMMTALPDDTIPPTTERTDTLKEVEVIAPGRTSGLEDALRQSLERMGIRNPVTLGNLIDKISPNLTDKILHPFAFKERRKAKKRKKVQKILDDFDRTKTFDDLVREALKREGITLPPKEEKSE